jgi:RHS repeat-associated protein
VQSAFDSEGKVGSVSSRGAGHAPHIFANAFHYNDKGVMDRLRLGNGLWEGSTINSRYQTTQITLGTSSGGTELLKLDYNYGSNGNNGNVLSQTITVPTIGTATGFVTTQAYTYDALNRLATVAETQYGQTTADWRQQFGFDPYGNRAMGTGTTQTFGRNSTETQSLIGPDPTVSTSSNRITNRTGEHYEFDASGNMTKDALGNRSVYDIENHQTEYYYVANTGSIPDAKYYYDGDGKRIKKVVGTETTVFVYDPTGRLVAEYTVGVNANPSPQTNYITTDTLGSTRLVTNGAGQVVARHDYLPFGDEIYGLGGRTSAQGFSQPDTTRKRFTGYEHDTETGLDFAQARYYGNGLGRFTSVDPILESAQSSDPQTWNRFILVVNNPLKYVDPTGMRGESAWDRLTKKERRLIGSILIRERHGRHTETAKEAFNRLLGKKLSGADQVDNVVAAMRTMLDVTGARSDGPIWQRLRSLYFLQSGDGMKIPVGAIGYMFTLKPVNGWFQTPMSEFIAVLEHNNYVANMQIAGYDERDIIGDHKNSIRFSTPSPEAFAPHWVQQPDYASNQIDLHIDPSNSNCSDCNLGDKLGAGIKHLMSHPTAVITRISLQIQRNANMTNLPITSP